jgi:hypothetical protein
MSICHRIQAKNQYERVISILGDEETQRVKSLRRSTDLPNANKIAGKRRPTLPRNSDAIPSSTLQNTLHGAKNHLSYQEICKDKGSFSLVFFAIPMFHSGKRVAICELHCRPLMFGFPARRASE